MRFLTEDMTPIPEPDDAILRTFHAGHQGRYRRPTWNSFTHIFFSTDKGDAAARARAVAALTSLSPAVTRRSEEHTSELQSLMRNSYAVFCLTKKKTKHTKIQHYKT